MSPTLKNPRTGQLVMLSRAWLRECSVSEGGEDERGGARQGGHQEAFFFCAVRRLAWGGPGGFSSEVFSIDFRLDGEERGGLAVGEGEGDPLAARLGAERAGSPPPKQREVEMDGDKSGGWSGALGVLCRRKSENDNDGEDRGGKALRGNSRRKAQFHVNVPCSCA